MAFLEGADSGLGYMTKSASTPVNTGVYEIGRGNLRRKQGRRKRVWGLRWGVGEIGFERVAQCGKRVVPGRVVSIRRVDGEAYYSGVRMCGCVHLCPVCAAKIARARAEELRRGMERWVGQAGVVTMMTLTVRHDRSDNLADLLNRMSQAQRGFYSGRWYQNVKDDYGVVGSVRNLECTWGSWSGWHPHSHVLLFSKQRLDPEMLYKRWSECCERNGLYVAKTAFLEGVTCSLDYADPASSIPGYVTKILGDKGDWTVAEELAFSHVKQANGRLSPMQIMEEFLETGEVRFANLFREYANAYHGKRHLYWSKGLRQVLGLSQVEQTDEEVANADGETDEILLTIPAQTWRHIVKLNLRLELLEWVENYGVAYVEDYLLAVTLTFFNSS